MSGSWGEIAPRRAWLWLALASLSLGALGGCESELLPVDESNKEITSFVFLERDNPALDSDLRASITGRLISLRAPFGTRVKALKPTITHTGNDVTPASGESQDFTNPIEYRVTGSDGGVRVYTALVAISPPSTSKDITSFQIAGVEATIDAENIALTLPYGTDRSALRGFIAHTGARVKPASGSTQNFNSPVEYTVIAHDGSTKRYTATVNLAPSNAKDITQFRVGDSSGEINANQITLTLPYGTDLSTVVPAITFSGASVEPQSGSPTDFRAPVVYTVTAADGSTKKYKVAIELAADSAKDITAFSILGVNGTISGAAIALTLPLGTDVTQLTPTVTHSGHSLSPASGEARDFSAPVTYRVEAADGSAKEYSVTVSLGTGGSNEITSFSVAGCQARISAGAISLMLPFGATLNNLTPDVEYTGAKLEPPSGAPQNFSQPIDYTVTAANGSTRTYRVTIEVGPNTAREITAFSILGVSGVIAGHTIRLTLPYGTDPHALQAMVEHTGHDLEPASGQTRDFSEPVVYTVTAADGTLHQYVVTVNVAPSMAKEITRFAILGMNAAIDGDAIALTVPFGTQLAGLAPIVEHTGASVTPGGGVPQNFGEPIVYIVTAADGSTRSYTVRVQVAPDNAKEITAFSVAGVGGTVGPSTIMITVPYGTPIEALTPDLMINGRSVSPASGVTQDFRGPITYVVTAQDGTTRSYAVTVQVAPNTAKDILAFNLLSVAGEVGMNAISVTLPYGTELTALTPGITISGASISPPSGAAVDFTRTVIYTVSADDGSTKQYSVNVAMRPPGDCAAIERFRPDSPSGVYTVAPGAAGSVSPFTVYCDLTHYGGGWTLVGKVGSGNFNALSDEQYLALIANPIADVNASLLQIDTAPVPGQIAFYDRTKTNALYNHTGALRAVRIDVTGNRIDLTADGTYFQQRVSAPAGWDFWAALRNALLWNRDGSTTVADGEAVAYFGVDFVFTNIPSDFDPSQNRVAARGDSDFGAFGTYTHTLIDGSSLTVSRRFGLLGGYNGIWGLWLLTADPNDAAWKNDESFQCSTIWLR